jgi:hypothetical protein
VTVADLPAQVRVGLRAESVRRAWPVAPVVVVVPDEASYVRAVGAWTLKSRYPVLIDDGSAAAREDVARFVRGFGPERVVRWSAAEAGEAKPPVTQKDDKAPAASAPLPADGPARRELIEATVRGVWSQLAPQHPPANGAELIELWKKGGVAPPGLVVADEADAAWPAALALSAGRAQPIVWVKLDASSAGGGGVNGAMSLEKFAALAEAVEGAAEKSGLSWRELGDELDAVTLCLNAPAKVQFDPATMAATTDMLGRRPDGDPGKKGPPRQFGGRWAYCGQIFGSAERSAYMAMCALFIEPRSAWVFDGYPDSKPWDAYSGPKAAEIFQKTNFPVTVESKPKGTERQWRLRTSGGLDAGLVLVNTKGMADEFALEPGNLRSGDVPFLQVPAIVHIVHSWSLTLPAERATVGGRWLERGAYAYTGSVQEPFLTAFVPTPTVAARLMAPIAWGCAVRVDGMRAWKIAVMGDPLITVGPRAPRTEATVPLAGAREMSEEARGAVGAKRFAEAIRLLTMLGRDADAAKLSAALLRDDPKSVDVKTAKEMVLPAARARDTWTLVRAFAILPTNEASDGVLRDALWHACYLELPTTTDQAMIAVLRSNLREDQVARDAADLAGAVQRLVGRDAAFTMLAEAKEKSRNDSDKQKAEEAIKRLTVDRVPVGR